jgi:YD repeat-containing protein
MKILNILLLLLLLAAQCAVPEARAQANCPGNGAGEPGCAAAGNPLNVITGNKFQREVDLAPLPGVMGLEIVRYYNSSLSGINSRTGILGRGWRLSYETTLAAIGDTVQVLQADGTRLIFARDLLRPSLCSSADPANGEIDVRRTPKGDEYVWRKNDGQRLSFNHQGRLVQILAPTGEFVSMQHDARGWLVKVTDPQGRSLTLDYLDRKTAAAGTRFSGVQGIESPKRC